MNGPARYDEIVKTLEGLAAESDRVKLSYYGTSSGGFRLPLLTISSPSNLGRLATISNKLDELDACVHEQDASSALEGIPVIVWLGYGIHGDELSGPDAAVEVVRRLTTACDSATCELLEHLIIHVDPIVNPDGRERCLAHVRTFGRGDKPADLQDALHTVAWPGGRGNRFLFDLNRDAVFGVQAESRARAGAILAARPQLFVDAHEMGPADTFLFAVPAAPFNPHLPAAVHVSWSDFASDHAAMFDADGSSFYTRSWNEVFYPGFFDIWPAYHGAVPVLYEQAQTSGGTVRLPSGRTRSYRTAIDNQIRSTFASLGTASRMRSTLLSRWWKSRRSEAHSRREWIIPPDNSFKQRRLLSMLLRQGVEVERLVEPARVEGLHSAWECLARDHSLPAGTLRVRTAQPAGALVRNIFDFHVPLEVGFLRRERRALERGGKTLLFDATAWSVAFAFGMDCFWSSQSVSGNWLRVKDTTAALASSSASVDLALARYGYVFRDPSLHATARLLARGVKIRVATEEFAMSERGSGPERGPAFQPGDLLIRLDDQSGDIRSLLLEEQARGEALFEAVKSARVAEGPDLGGPEFVLLAPPAIAIVTGVPMDAPSTGALLHLFDQVIGLPVTLIDMMRLGSTDLANYGVLILGDVSEKDLFLMLLRNGSAEKLRAWVEQGGTLIALSTAALALAEAGFTTAKTRSATFASSPADASVDFARAPADSVRRAVLGQDCGQVGLARSGAQAGSAYGSAEADIVMPLIGEGARAFLPQGFTPFELSNDAFIATPGLAASLRRFSTAWSVSRRSSETRSLAAVRRARSLAGVVP
ncbi:MAG: M14 family zinc carboxypeptidase [Gammaproteobacteria bacterium]